MTTERTCIVCKNKKSKNELTRIVLEKTGQIKVEKSKKIDGRGAYICKGDLCLDKLLKTHALNRTFKRSFNDKVYLDLIDEIKKA